MERADFIRAAALLRERIGITRSEYRAFLVLGTLLILGTSVRNWHERIPSIDPAMYAVEDSLFLASARRIWASLPYPVVGPKILDEALPPSTRLPGQGPVDGSGHALLDLNSATADALDLLPRVGPKTAEAILRERERLGGFRFVEDLLLVPGIGEVTLNRLRPFVRVVPPPDSLVGSVR